MVPKSLRPLLPYLKKYRRGYVVGTVCVFLTTASGVCSRKSYGRAVNDLNLGITRKVLLTYSLLLIAVALTKGVFQYLTRWIVIGISREIEFDLRNDLSEHLRASRIRSISAPVPVTSWREPPMT